MAKVKNKSRKSAEAISRKLANKKKTKLNPFEVHINNEKLKVLGRKVKNDRGKPGVSRSKAIEIRTKTLLPEYNQQHKCNAFRDKRIGERAGNMSSEDKNVARYTALRVKQHNRKSIFNLADDEILTHRGQTLSEIEKFDDPKSEDEDDNAGKLDSKFVEELHFGGGMLKKADENKSHKDLVEQLIIESKKRKLEMQKQKDATVQLTEKLDSEWKDLLPIVSLKQKDTADDDKGTVEDYDKLIRSLKFEARGKPSEKLKSEDEIAREERETLERLESERLERMRGTYDSNQQTHKSADDLDCNYIDEDIDENATLSYDHEGNLNTQSMNEDENVSINSHSSSDHEENEEFEEDNESNEEISEEHEDKNQISNSDNTNEIIQQDLQRRKEIMEQARLELPFTYSLPSSYEEFERTMKNQSAEHQGVIVERMIKCNHPSLKEGNKAGLEMLFAYQLQHLQDVCTEIEDPDGVRMAFRVLDNLTPHFYSLTVMSPENAGNCMRAVLTEKQHEFRGKRKYPGIEILLFFKLIGGLFSTSDFEHPVVTPAMIFIEQLLINSRVTTTRSITYGLFLVSIFHEYTESSKRYLAAVVHFLNGVIHAAIPKIGVQLFKIAPPFKSQSTFLVLSESYPDGDDDSLKISNLWKGNANDAFKHNAIAVTVSLLQRSFNNWKELPSSYEIFVDSLRYLKLLPLTHYRERVRQEIENFVCTLEELKENRKLEYCTFKTRKPKPMRLYEPNIVQIFDEKRHKLQSRAKAEREKLMYKVKKARKGAVKEIRRDRAFIGRVKLNKQLQSDAERKEKVKRIMSEAAAQQSEMNSMDRSNKRKKSK